MPTLFQQFQRPKMPTMERPDIEGLKSWAEAGLDNGSNAMLSVCDYALHLEQESIEHTDRMAQLEGLRAADSAKIESLEAENKRLRERVTELENVVAVADGLLAVAERVTGSTQ